MIIFDIETGPLPQEQLQGMFDKNYVPSDPPGDFDPASVKYGNTQDPVKRAAKLKSEQEKHEDLVRNWDQVERDRKQEAWQKFSSSAALHALTGQVLAVGYYSQARQAIVIDGGDNDNGLPAETSILKNFWVRYLQCRNTANQLCGFNVFGFDLPFLMRRSWLNEVEVPATVYQHNRWDYSVLRDLLDVWKCGRREEFIGLGELCQYLGLGDKPDGVTGADFARLWLEDREQAEAYLANDLELTDRLAYRLNILC